MTPTLQRLAAALALSFVATAPSLAKQAGATLAISAAKIDSTVARAMRTFEVPGIAVGIVKDGKLIFAKGYGVREYGKPERVDPDTLFQIGSNTKAFTAAALAILVDEGKVHWDDKVIDYLPEFRMYDPYVTREFTVSDLLTHRSGLGRGAGDLMSYPTTDFTRAEIIHGLRYLKPVAGFRYEFAYDNLLYMVAGEVVRVASGQSWEDFITGRVLDPLQMKPCGATYERLADRSDIASPHQVIDGRLTPVPIEDLSTAIGPAGSINCSINGMAKWLQTQLGGGMAPDGRRLFSEERQREMWSIHTIKPLDPQRAALSQTHFMGYGYGWGLQDTFGRKRVSHTGGMPGTVTSVTLIPELQLGVLVFTNQESNPAMEAIGNQILDAYLGAPARDWVDLAAARQKGRDKNAHAVEEAVAKTAATAGPPTLPLDAYAGRYADPWRGEATVRREGDKLILKISRTRDLEGSLSPYSGNIFIVRWNERRFNADAFVRFTQGFDGKIEGMTMRAISPATDFSFDFQDLDFRKAESAAPAR